MKRESFSRRGRLEIIHNILSLCLKPAQKTYIMYQANLSYKQLQKYLEYLVKAKLLEVTKTHQEDLYITADKGKNFIEEYKKLLDIIK